jgi:hypothetical protein
MKKTTEVNLNVLPQFGLFRVNNMKPGDKFLKELVIKNSLGSDYIYHFNVYQESGSSTLYNQLIIQIVNNGNTLYKGKLVTFNGFLSKNINGPKKEKLNVIIEFPYDSSNEFQGKRTTIVFKVSGNGIFGYSMPNTNTNIFNMILAGFLIVISGIFLKFYNFRSKKYQEKL